MWAVERSIDAHAWAMRNVDRFGAGRVTLLRGDVADLGAGREGTALARSMEHLTGRVDVIVTNPPYVPETMVPREPEVRDHDPHVALFGGVDGLDVIRTISAVAQHLLAPGGLLVVEHAESQGAAVRQILTAAGLRAAATHRDLTGRDRATTALRPPDPRTADAEE